MRWKLLIVAALLAALAGTLPLLLGFYFGVIGSTPETFSELFLKPNTRILLSLILPVATITYSSIFVYRHTARRRALQATITALLAVLLTFAALKLDAMLLNKSPRSHHSFPSLKHDA
ncbi:MAG: hypothetical protein H0V88_11355 [Pyrinomonadaceae bacterium]|nr:hypothetical protein [Pyrinomonadaceae bacterium]